MYPLCIGIRRYFYFMHRWFHSNKLAFRLFHAHHHETSVQLDISTTFYSHPIDYIFDLGIPLVATCWLAHTVVGNFWYHAATVYQVGGFRVRVWSLG